MTHDRRQEQGQLEKDLALRAEESLDELLTRAMPVLQAFYPGKVLSFERYYGLNGQSARTYTEIAKEIRQSRTHATYMVGDAFKIVLDTLEVMRAEHKMPGDYLNWEPSAFFSYERAVAIGINPHTFSRIRTVIEFREPWKTMAAFTDETEKHLLALSHVGQGVLEALKILLASEGLSLKTWL